MKKLLFLTLLTSLIISCSRTEPEQEIRDNIAVIQQALTEKDAGDIKSLIAEHFVGVSNEGTETWDRQQLYRFLVANFLQHNSVAARPTRLDITLDSNDPFSASMSGTVLITGSNRWIPEEGRLLSFNGHWQRIDGQWQVSRLEWQ